MTLSMDKLALNINKLVSEYTDLVQDKISARIDKCADEVLEYIKANAPKSSDISSKHLADSFVKTIIGSGKDKTIYISSKTKYRLVHLIELGFKHKGGKFISARPFLRPALDNFTPSMLEDIKRIIGGVYGY
jgi:hypothetical protein